jgi:hypothetical protein
LNLTQEREKNTKLIKNINEIQDDLVAEISNQCSGLSAFCRPNHTKPDILSTLFFLRKFDTRLNLMFPFL